MNLAVRSTAALLVVLLMTPGLPAAQLTSASGPGSAKSVTLEELSDSDRRNVYDFVRAHRPLWLRTRGTSVVGTASVMAYLDGHLLGPATELRGIPTAMVSELRYMDGREATTRWGINHGNGAILVLTGPPGVVAARGVALKGQPGGAPAG